MHALITRLNTANTRSHRLVFLGIFMLAIGLRILCFEGYADANPRAYAMLAQDLSAGELHIPDESITPVFPVRIGAYAPAAGLIGLFGLSEITMVGFVFLVDLMSLVLIYVVCRTAFGGCAGLIGLLLLGISPLDVSMGSRFLPHLVAAFWANLGMCLVWAVIAMDVSSRRRWLGAGLAGLCFGWSWMTYESVAYLVPPVALILLFSGRERTLKQRVQITLLIGMGSMFVLAGEMGFLWWRTGDLLYRLHATENNYEVCSEFFFVQSSTRFGWDEDGFSRIIFERLFIDGPRQILLGRALGGITLLGLIAVVWSLVTKRRSLFIPGVWLVSLVVLFNFMTTSFESYKPLPIIPYLARYLSPLLFPSAVLCAGLISSLMLPRKEGARDRIGLSNGTGGIIVLVLACGCALPGLLKYTMQDQFSIERKMVSLLNEDDVLFTDMRSAGNIIFLRNGVLEERTRTTIPFEEIAPESLPPGAFILINDSMKQLLIEGFQYTPPPYFEATNPEWTLIWEKPQARIYQVGPSPSGR